MPVEDIMKKLLRIAAIGVASISAASGLASAQTTAVGYTFGSPGFASCGCDESLAIMHAGGGGEARIGGVIGVGADIGYVAPFEYFSEGVGLLSVNGTYYFPYTGRARRTQPFVTGGYSMLFRDGSEHLANVGFGVDHWVTRTDRSAVANRLHDPFAVHDRSGELASHKDCRGRAGKRRPKGHQGR
jgi:hypothetical protein